MLMTPDEENELICTKLLGWKKEWRDAFYCVWVDSKGRWRSDPDFDSWEFAGMILDAMLEKGKGIHTVNKPIIRLIYNYTAEAWWCEKFNGFGTLAYLGATGPLAIRAAALAYLNET
jgi:hypothetical protein